MQQKLLEKLKAISDNHLDNIPDEPDKKSQGEYSELVKAYGVITDIELRKVFAWVMIVIIIIWLIFVMVIIILLGANIIVLPETVMNFLITSTTADLLGIVYLIYKYLFNPNKT